MPWNQVCLLNENVKREGRSCSVVEEHVGDVGRSYCVVRVCTLAKGSLGARRRSRDHLFVRVQEIALEISIFDGGLWKLLLLAALA